MQKIATVQVLKELFENSIPELPKETNIGLNKRNRVELPLMDDDWNYVFEEGCSAFFTAVSQFPDLVVKLDKFETVEEFTQYCEFDRPNLMATQNQQFDAMLSLVGYKVPADTHNISIMETLKEYMGGAIVVLLLRKVETVSTNKARTLRKLQKRNDILEIVRKNARPLLNRCLLLFAECSPSAVYEIGKRFSEALEEMSEQEWHQHLAALFPKLGN
jgi:hypothetical protein